MNGSPNLRESYLRIVLELEEEGILPLRARLVERSVARHSRSAKGSASS